MDDDKLQEFFTNIPEGMKETVALLQRCRERRKALQILNILKYQYVIGCPGTEEYAVFKELEEKNKGEYTSPFTLSDVFNYGFIEGKRAERARRRK